MTRRGGALLLAAAALAGWGWRAHWPEALGAGGRDPRPRLAGGPADGPGAARHRGSRPVVGAGRARPASRRDPVGGRPGTAPLVVGRRGDARAPAEVVRLPRAASIRMPVDTSQRGQRPVGPYFVVHGDPWGLVRRVVAGAEGGTLTVQPRTFPVRRWVTAAFEAGNSDSASRRSGDQHFHALRDYVLGDEPRSVHWRSSARAGKLVVRQQVSAASTGTTVVLDVDGSAYGSGSKFGAGWDDELFEVGCRGGCLAGREPARPYGAGPPGDHRRRLSGDHGVGGRCELAARHARRRPGRPPAETRPDELPAVVRRTRAAHTIVVTSRPGHRTLPALRRLVQAGRTTIVAVGTGGPVDVPGARLVLVTRPQELGSV